MKLIVTDLDGTLLNTKKEISPKNVEALLSAQAKGVEIAIATGRTYANTLAICQRAGLQPHIISNNGSFVYTKDGVKIMAIGLDRQPVKNAVSWLTNSKYFYTLCTDNNIFMPSNADFLLTDDFETAGINPAISRRGVEKTIKGLLSLDGVQFVHHMEDFLEEDHTFANISAFSFHQKKLQQGRDYFSEFAGMSMTVSGSFIFEMLHTSASKGNAVEHLSQYLNLPLEEVMAIGDHYNDISMLERVGISVAMGNGEEAVKTICKFVAPSNENDGVGHMINQMLGRVG